jgi:hypothetical protein
MRNGGMTDRLMCAVLNKPQRRTRVLIHFSLEDDPQMARMSQNLRLG